MRIGVIGCGGMGTTHYLSLKVLSEKEDDVEVVALSDCRKEFLDKAASYFPEAATSVILHLNQGPMMSYSHAPSCVFASASFD